MDKIIILLMTIWTLSITNATYLTRMTAMNRIRAPVAFRPGVMLQRPYPQRIIQTATRRAPYIIYRNTPHRYAMKHLSPAPVRSVLGPWKTTRIPLGSSTPTVFVRAASPSPVIHADGTGAIHTIPAPNLSLLEKPIVVIDSLDSPQIQEPQKTTYEVTEKNSEQPYQSNPKIESPIGFSKASSPSAVDLQNVLRQNTALQMASEYTLPVHFSQPAVQLQQPSIVPQQFTLQGFHAIPNQQDLLYRGPEQIIIPQNAFYPPDSLFMQKVQNQFVHQFPDAEFIPYTPEIQPQYKNTANTQPSETQNEMILLQNEEITKRTPSAFISSDGQKNLVQRETQESSFVSIVPKAFTAKNITENLIETDVIASTIENVTSNILPTEIQTTTTTIKNEIETTTEDIRPVFYAQIGQSVGNVIAKGFYSAINDVRAAADANKAEKEIKSDNKLENTITIQYKPTTTSTTSTSTTTSSTTTASSTTTTSTTTAAPTTQSTTNAPIKTESKKENKKSNLPKLSLGSPFEKATTTPSVNIAYTLLRAKDKQPRINEDGEVFAGQLVEAKISEDQEFNKEKANLINRPVRFAVTEKKISESTSKRSVVKAKIPPKSKLTFDDKTGEPVLRVYASYVDSPGQKEIITTKLSNLKRNKDKDVTRKQDLNIDWKEDDIKSFEKSLADVGQEEQFGLRLRSRSDYYVPIFEDYEEK